MTDLTCEICVITEWSVVAVVGGGSNWVSVGVGYLANHSIQGEFKFALLSLNSNQYCSNAFSGGTSPLLPAIIDAFSPPIDVPAIMSIFILLFASALKTPQPKAPKNLHLEVSTHSQQNHQTKFCPSKCHYLLSLNIVIVDQLIIEPD
jgi:hypothetical protein